MYGSSTTTWAYRSSHKPVAQNASWQTSTSRIERIISVDRASRHRKGVVAILRADVEPLRDEPQLRGAHPSGVAAARVETREEPRRRARAGRARRRTDRHRRRYRIAHRI